jgi:hypothetical protein
MQLLQLDDSVFNDFIKQLHSWEVNWKRTRKEKNSTEQCYSEKKAHSAKFTHW